MTRNAKALQAKSRQCAVALMRRERSMWTAPKFLVKSPSSSEYIVTELGSGKYHCPCKWGQFHDTSKDPCVHVLAVMRVEAQIGQRALSFWARTDDAKRQRRKIERVGRGLWATSRRIPTDSEKRWKKYNQQTEVK